MFGGEEIIAGTTKLGKVLVGIDVAMRGAADMAGAAHMVGMDGIPIGGGVIWVDGDIIIWDVVAAGNPR